MVNKFLILGILAILLLGSAVMAQELPNPGMLPDSPFYPVKRFVENVRLWLTFDSEARARFQAFLAEQRLAELNATIAKGNFQHVQKLEDDYENDVNETETEMNRTFGLGKNATSLAEHVCNMTYKHILVLQRVLERAPEPAKKGLERAINASVKGHENCLERLEDVLNETNDTLRRFRCVADAECLNLTVKCPESLGFQVGCFIQENRTVGSCKCMAKWNKTAINCTDDEDCRVLACPLILGNDTAICLNNRCFCGARWQLVNRTEWKERFREEYTNYTAEIQEMIREKIEAEIRRRG